MYNTIYDLAFGLGRGYGRGRGRYRDGGCLFHDILVDSDENEHVISVEMPGVEKKDLDIEVSKDILTVKWKKKDVDYYRSFYIPDDSNLDKSSSEYKNGVLVIKIPRKKPKIKKIEIK